MLAQNVAQNEKTIALLKESEGLFSTNGSHANFDTDERYIEDSPAFEL